MNVVAAPGKRDVDKLVTDEGSERSQQAGDQDAVAGEFVHKWLDAESD